MRAISFIFIHLMFTSIANASDEYWGIYQFKKNVSDSNFLFAEYVRRDSDDFFKRKNLDLFRFSVGGKWNLWTYQVGGSYVNFANSNDERRLHQFLIKNFNISDSLSSVVRIGLEQRSFISDTDLYLRARVRGQANYSFISNFGLSIYDELLFALNGSKRFYQGFNENRFGLGLRFKSEQVEILIYQTYAYLRSLKSETKPQWIQLQTVFSF